MNTKNLTRNVFYNTLKIIIPKNYLYYSLVSKPI